MASLHHFVGASRWSADSKYSIASLEKPARDGVKDLNESLDCYLLGSSRLDQRKRQPLSQDWDASGPKNIQGVRFHLPNISADPSGSSFVPER